MKKERKLAVVLHLYYQDLFHEFHQILNNIETDYDLFITVNNLETKVVQEIKNYHPNCNLLCFENKGRDVLPFLKVTTPPIPNFIL